MGTGSVPGEMPEKIRKNRSSERFFRFTLGFQTDFYLILLIYLCILKLIYYNNALTHKIRLKDEGISFINNPKPAGYFQIL